MDSTSDPARALLRHTLATVAYRGGKTVRDAPPGFADFIVGSGTTRTPGAILAHIGDLFDWGLSLARGEQRWRHSTPLPWDEEIARFFATLQAFDDYLASDGAAERPSRAVVPGPGRGCADARRPDRPAAAGRRWTGSRRELLQGADRNRPRRRRTIEAARRVRLIQRLRRQVQFPRRVLLREVGRQEIRRRVQIHSPPLSGWAPAALTGRPMVEQDRQGALLCSAARRGH